jgi:hypothetical protein
MLRPFPQQRDFTAEAERAQDSWQQAAGSEQKAEIGEVYTAEAQRTQSSERED